MTVGQLKYKTINTFDWKQSFVLWMENILYFSVDETILRDM